MVAYADDVTIAVIYKNQVKKVLREVEEWAKDYEMRFNKNKSVIMIHKKATIFEDVEEIQSLKKVEETKVLGY